MGRLSTGERLDVKSGPSWVLPLKAEREGVDGEVNAEDVVGSELIDGGVCGGDGWTATCSRACSRRVNSRL